MPFLFRIIEYRNNSSSGDKSNCIPVVLLVIEGGIRTLRTVLKSVKSDLPVPIVVAKGSGRAADILAYAYKLERCVLAKVREVRSKKDTGFMVESTRLPLMWPGLSLLVLVFAPKGFFFSVLQFLPLLKNQHSQIPIPIRLTFRLDHFSDGKIYTIENSGYKSNPFTIIYVKNKSNGNINV